MSTYNDASLIYYPSGYKASKAYSLKPTDGSGDLTFTRASTATRVNKSGLIESVATGVPRIDFTGGGCGKLLLEPQRTNLLTQSENLSTAAWAKANLTVSLSSVLSPNGTTFAYKLTNDAIVGNHFTRNTITVSSGLSYTLSCFIKKGTRSIVTIADGFNTNELATFDLINVTATNKNIGTNSTIASYNNDWYKCSVSIFVASTSLGFMLFSGNTYAGGDTSGDFYAWGCQIEQGTYPTSYIPTTTTAVTRVADRLSRNNIYTNGLITASGGTWFVELQSNFSVTNFATDRGVFIGDTTAGTANALAIRRLSSGRNQIVKVISGSSTNLFTTTTDTVKIAIKWNVTTADLFVNGVKVVSSTAFAATIMENLGTRASEEPYQFIQSMMLFPTPKSDAELIALTTI